LHWVLRVAQDDGLVAQDDGLVAQDDSIMLGLDCHHMTLLLAMMLA